MKCNFNNKERIGGIVKMGKNKNCASFRLLGLSDLLLKKGY